MALAEMIAEVTVWDGGEDPFHEHTTIVEVTEIDRGWDRAMEIRIPLDGSRDVYVKVRPEDLLRLVTDALMSRVK
jgi:hypothetical protein